MGLKIKEAIKRFNATKKESAPKMTQTTLGVAVLPNMRPKTASWYISQWGNGLEEGKLKIKEILIIRKETGVSLDFLFDITKENN